MSDFFGFGAITNAINNHLMGFQNNYFNKKASKKAYERSLYMSNSAHQREVADLEAAGLNPVLSAIGNGAATVSVPVGGSNPMSGGNIVNASSNEKAEWKLLESHREKMDSEKAAADSLSVKNTADAARSNAETVGIKADNILKVAKSDWFQGLDKAQQYEVINSMMFPSNEIGQIRGIVSTLFDTGADGNQGGRNSAKSISQGEHRSSIEQSKESNKPSRPINTPHYQHIKERMYD